MKNRSFNVTSVYTANLSLQEAEKAIGKAIDQELKLPTPRTAPDPRACDPAQGWRPAGLDGQGAGMKTFKIEIEVTVDELPEDERQCDPGGNGC